MEEQQAKNILVACTGSVASLKVPQIVEELQKLSFKVNIEVVPTEHSLHFFNSDTLPVKIHRDEEEWKTWEKRGDPVLHIELRRWADLLLIAPLDANTMGKMCYGICDNLLTCVVRAWDRERPLLFAPAMNTYMWEHPLTATQITTLKSFGYTEIPCVEKTLICGDTGLGAMAEVSDITNTVKEALQDKNAVH